MQYISYRFEIVNTPGELLSSDAFDILSATLVEIGFDSFLSETDFLEAFIPAEKVDDRALQEALCSLPIDDLRFSYKSKLHLDKNWNEDWEKNYFQPLNIGGRCYVRAQFHPAAPVEVPIEIVILPKMAFGTGHHQTTSLILNHLLNLKDMSFFDTLDGSLDVLDAGCGSGILGILAAKLGATTITAIDIDSWSIENTLENTKINGVADLFTVRQEDVTKLAKDSAHDKTPSTFDLITANITLNIIIDTLPTFAKLLAENGKLLVSGFFASDIDKINEYAIKSGLKVNKTDSMKSLSGDVWAMIELVATHH